MKMNIKSYFALLLVIMLTTSFTKDEAANNRFKGVWQLVSMNYGKGDSKPNMVMLKIFGDSSFQSYVCSPGGSVQTIEGKYKVLSDTLYKESVIEARNAAMNGQTYDIKYKMNSRAFTISGMVDIKNADGSAGKTAFQETWVKIEFQ